MLDEVNLAALVSTAAENGPDPQPDHPLPAQPEHSDMEFPAWIWTAMFACYALFFTGLAVATRGDLEAGFVIVISAAYTLMYFGTARVLVALKQDGHQSRFTRGAGPLATFTGPMSTTAVVSQVLVIPLCLALFGVAIAVIVAIVA